MSKKLADLLRSPSPSTVPLDRREATMRAPSLIERFNQVSRDVFRSAADQPLGRLADLLGLTDLHGMSTAEPGPEVLSGMPSFGPGRVMPTLSATGRPLAYRLGPKEYAVTTGDDLGTVILDDVGEYLYVTHS